MVMRRALSRFAIVMSGRRSAIRGEEEIDPPLCQQILKVSQVQSQTEI